MEYKVPQLRSCCFFLPLKEGLLTLGYINLVYHGLLSIIAVFAAFWVTIIFGFGNEFPPIEWSLLLPFVTISEVVFNVLVVVASHKNDRRLLKMILIFGTALWVFTVLYGGCIAGRLGALLHSTDYSMDDQAKLVIHIIIVVSDPLILGFELLLVRSLKLQLQGEIQGLEHIDLETNRARPDYERLLPPIQ